MQSMLRVLGALLLLPVASSLSLPKPSPKALVTLARASQRRTLRSTGPEPPVNATNELPVQVVELYEHEDCRGPTASFTSSGNAFLKEFGPFVKNLWSVKLCGKGTFFYFSDEDMHVLSTLGQ